LERCWEKSENSKSMLGWMWLAILGLAVWLGIEINSWLRGHLSLLGFAYIFFFCGLLVWRYAVRYDYRLTREQVVITSKFLWLTYVLAVDITAVESYSGQYIKKAFRSAGITQYLYRYSSGDGRPTRILIFSKKEKLKAILFRVSDSFMDELRKRMPEREIDFSGRNSGELVGQWQNQNK
jgi:hypothetical protein